MGTFGDTLRQAREDLGASLEDAERETHIHRRYLDALENEEAGKLPAQVYTRGFIRTYCQYLGLNPDAMVDLFGPKRVLQETVSPRPIPAQFSSPRQVTLKPVLILGAVIMAGLLFAYLWAQYTSFVESLGRAEQLPSRVSGTPAAPRGAAPQAAVPTPSPSPVAVASPIAPPTPIRGLVVEARVVERTWMEAWADDRPVVAEIMQPGTVRTFTAEQRIRMRVSNAGGVQVIVNGTSQGQLGSPGQAVDASWGRQ
ncbi:MAG: DUF4115 domain-containing protein [Chloroflexota bacterium]